MAAYVQKATGNFRNGGGGPETTAVASLSGVSDGNSIIAIVRGGSYNYASPPACSVSDGAAYALAARGVIDAGGNIRPLAEIHYLHNASAGEHTITATMSAGPWNCYGSLDVFEVSGLAQAGAEATADNGNASSNTPATGNSGSTTTPTGIAIAACAVLGSGSISLAASGYTNLYEDESLNADNVGGSSDYKLLASVGVQSASWGDMGASKPWAVALATFGDAGGAGGQPIAARRRGVPGTTHGQIFGRGW